MNTFLCKTGWRAKINQILIVDQDDMLCDTLTQYLEVESYVTRCTHDGDTAVKMALNHPYNAIIMDLILPNKNGLEVIRNIREFSKVPILVLSTSNQEIDRLLALEIGADEFLTKPCNPHHLIAHLQALLNRTQNQPNQKLIIHYRDILVDTIKREVSISGEILDLTNTEFNVIEMLIKSPGQAFSKEELTEYALGRKFTAYDRSIDVHISNLRNKLGNNESGEPWLKTVRGFGYMFGAS